MAEAEWCGGQGKDALYPDGHDAYPMAEGICPDCGQCERTHLGTTHMKGHLRRPGEGSSHD